MYDIIGNAWIQDDFCSAFAAPPPALITGNVDGFQCFQYDDTEWTFPFTPITHPSCPDTGILTYAVDFTGTDLEHAYFKITADPNTNLITARA